MGKNMRNIVNQSCNPSSTSRDHSCYVRRNLPQTNDIDSNRNTSELLQTW